MEALEGILMEHIHLGEEVSHDFAANVTVKLIEVWNSAVDKLRNEFETFLGKDRVPLEDDVCGSSQSHKAADSEATDHLRAIMDSLQKCEISSASQSVLILDWH